MRSTLLLAGVLSVAGFGSYPVGPTSAGSCYYGHTATPMIGCDVAEADCPEGNYWYEPGYVSSSSGCCHCGASCDSSIETS